MNLEIALLKEHSRKQTDKIVQFVGNNPDRFAALMKIFMGDHYRLTQRSAWAVSHCIELHPELAVPHIKRIIASLDRSHTPEAARRNVLRLLQYAQIPASQHGRLMDTCFRFLSDPETTIASRVFSLYVLDKLSAIYPEIFPEIKSVLEVQLPHCTAALRSAAKKVLYRKRNLGS